MQSAQCIHVVVLVAGRKPDTICVLHVQTCTNTEIHSKYVCVCYDSGSVITWMGTCMCVITGYMLVWVFALVCICVFEGRGEHLTNHRNRLFISVSLQQVV